MGGHRQQHGWPPPRPLKLRNEGIDDDRHALSSYATATQPRHCRHRPAPVPAAAPRMGSVPACKATSSARTCPTPPFSRPWVVGTRLPLPTCTRASASLISGLAVALTSFSPAKRVGPTGRAFGLDMTDEMLALALDETRRRLAPPTSSSSRGTSRRSRSRPIRSTSSSATALEPGCRQAGRIP